jgi:asparagine synthase (glutamine-hydrolysing)
MCGIAGILKKSDSKVLDIGSIVKTMTSVMEHRGPDAAGYFEENDKIALGHRRLAIIDLSEGGKQPKTDNSGRYTITFNGEIFNYREVKAKIDSYEFKSQSDTEVILAAYIKWGKSCLDYLVGQFAFAIWDRVEEKLFITRDRLGEKPFYYYENQDVFLFASEINALLISELVPKVVSKKGIVDYLKYQSVNAPYTIIENVYQLPAATYGIYADGKLTIKKYWDISNLKFESDYTN